jgi:hypothetical protein
MRCEPQPELRKQNGWHWVQDVSGYFLPTCARWHCDAAGGIWFFGGTQTARPSYAYRIGYRYLAPITPHATVAALVEALDELLADTQHATHDCGDDDCPVRRAHAALALYNKGTGQ